jgi:K+-sensing histidine kinase KdpD
MSGRADQSPDPWANFTIANRPPAEPSGRLLPAAAPRADGLAQYAPPVADSPRASEVEDNRDAFLAAISHELKSPLTTLCLSTQLLGRQFKAQGEWDRERAVHLIETIQGQSAKLAKLVNYLLDVSHTGPDAIPLERQETDLGALVGELVVATQARTTRHQIRVDAPAPVWATVDTARIEQVLVNLLDNAVKYSPDGGSIEVALAQHDAAEVSIAVRDHGIGVPRERRGYMFDRFSTSHDERVPGLGLGLYLARRLVELHAGKLTAEFPADGGTRMVVSLPSGWATSPQVRDHEGVAGC